LFEIIFISQRINSIFKLPNFAFWQFQAFTAGGLNEEAFYYYVYPSKYLDFAGMWFTK